MEDRESEGSTIQVSNVGNLCEYTRRTLSRSKRDQCLFFIFLTQRLRTSIERILFGSAWMICNLKPVCLARRVVVDVEVRAFVESMK